MQAPRFHDPTLEALTLTLVNIGCLWAWTWMQMLSVFWHGLPLFTTDVELALLYYEPIDRWGLSLPELFFFLTIGGVAVLIPAAFFFTRNVTGGRMMLVILVVCSASALGFSGQVLQWRKFHKINAALEILIFNERLQRRQAPEYSEDYRRRIRRLESFLRPAVR